MHFVDVTMTMKKIKAEKFILKSTLHLHGTEYAVWIYNRLVFRSC